MPLDALHAGSGRASLGAGEEEGGAFGAGVGDERERRDKEFLATQLGRVFEALPKAVLLEGKAPKRPPAAGRFTEVLPR